MLTSPQSFFFTAPRSWSKIPKQGGAEQQNTIAGPIATDVRFKLGSMLLGVAWLVVVYCVQHNLYYYRLLSHPARSTGRIRIGAAATVIRYLPIKYTMAIIVVAVRIAYGVACAFNFQISVLKYNSNALWPYILGYLPCVLVLAIFNIWGFIDKNEDKELIRQRVERGHVADQELGIAQKPNWWSKIHGDAHLDDMSRLRNMVADTNINSNQRDSHLPRTRTERQSRISQMSRGWSDMEMMSMRSPTSPGFSSPDHPPPRYEDSKTMAYLTGDEIDKNDRGRRPTSMLYPDSDLASPTDQASWLGRGHSPGGNSMASAATGTTLADGRRPQQVKSMLDV
jgi:hypothetical protein